MASDTSQHESGAVNTGACLCGAARYAFAGKPLGFVFCHCRDCQRVSGGGPAAVLTVPKAAFRLLQGELKTFTKRSDADTPAHRRFCPDCGAHIVSEVGSLPEVYFIKAGTLDTPAAFTPSANLWIRSKQPWTAIDPALKAFEKQT